MDLSALEQKKKQGIDLSALTNASRPIETPSINSVDNKPVIDLGKDSKLLTYNTQPSHIVLNQPNQIQPKNHINGIPTDNNTLLAGTTGISPALAVHAFNKYGAKTLGGLQQGIINAIKPPEDPFHIIAKGIDKLPIQDELKSAAYQGAMSALPRGVKLPGEKEAREEIVNFIENKSPISKWNKIVDEQSAFNYITSEKRGWIDHTVNNLVEGVADTASFLTQMSLLDKVTGSKIPSVKFFPLSSKFNKLALMNRAKAAVGLGLKRYVTAEGSIDDRMKQSLWATAYAGTPLVVGGLSKVAPKLATGIAAKVTDFILNSLLTTESTYKEIWKDVDGDIPMFLSKASAAMITDLAFSAMTEGLPEAEFKKAVEARHARTGSTVPLKEYIKEQIAFKNRMQKLRSILAKKPTLANWRQMGFEELDNKGIVDIVRQKITEDNGPDVIRKALKTVTEAEEKKYTPEAIELFKKRGEDFLTKPLVIQKQIIKLLSDIDNGKINTTKGKDSQLIGLRPTDIVYQPTFDAKDQIIKRGKLLYRRVKLTNGEWGPLKRLKKSEVPDIKFVIDNGWRRTEDFYTESKDPVERKQNAIDNFFHELKGRVLMTTGSSKMNPEEIMVWYNGSEMTLQELTARLLQDNIHPDDLEYYDVRGPKEKSQALDIKETLKANIRTLGEPGDKLLDKGRLLQKMGVDKIKFKAPDNSEIIYKGIDKDGFLKFKVGDKVVTEKQLASEITKKLPTIEKDSAEKEYIDNKNKEAGVLAANKIIDSTNAKLKNMMSIAKASVANKLFEQKRELAKYSLDVEKAGVGSEIPVEGSYYYDEPRLKLMRMYRDKIIPTIRKFTGNLKLVKRKGKKKSGDMLEVTAKGLNRLLSKDPVIGFVTEDEPPRYYDYTSTVELGLKPIYYREHKSYNNESPDLKHYRIPTDIAYRSTIDEHNGKKYLVIEELQFDDPKVDVKFGIEQILRDAARIVDGEGLDGIRIVGHKMQGDRYTLNKAKPWYFVYEGKENGQKVWRGVYDDESKKFTEQDIIEMFGKEGEKIIKKTESIINKEQRKIPQPEIWKAFNQVPPKTGVGDQYKFYISDRKNLERMEKFKALGGEQKEEFEVPVSNDFTLPVMKPKTSFANLVSRVILNGLPGLKKYIENWDDNPFSREEYDVGNAPQGWEEIARKAVFAKKNQSSFASFLGQNQMINIVRGVWDFVNRHHADEINAIKSKTAKRKVRQRYTKLYLDLMGFAMSEVAVNMGSKKGMLAKTDEGKAGPHKSSAAAEAYVKYKEHFHNELDEPYTKQDLNRWLNQRDELGFFELLPPELQSYIEWIHRDIFNPLLEAGIDSGVFDRANLFKSRQEGFSPRQWVMQEHQKGGGGFGQRIDNARKPAREFETFPEFMAATEGTDLVGIADASIMTGSYINEMIDRLAKQHLINTFKSVVSDDGTRMVEYEHNLMEEANQAIEEAKKKNAKYNLDDYIAEKLIQIGRPELIDKVKTLKGLLTAMGYTQIKNANGLAEWHRGMFRVPWVHKTVKDTINTLLQTPNSHQVFNILRAANRIIKTGVMFSPFMFALQIASTPLVWGVNPTKRLMSLPSKTVNIGKGIVNDKYDLNQEFAERLEKDNELLLKMKEAGLQAFNFDGGINALMDYTLKGDTLLTKSTFGKLMKFLGLKGGMDIAVFNDFISNTVFDMAKKVYSKLKKDGYTDDNALQMAVDFTNDVTGMINPAVYGNEGAVLQALLFARDFTMSFARQLTGATLGRTGFKRFRSTKFGDLFNSLLHGEKTDRELAALQKYYIANLAKVAAWSIIATNLVQLAVNQLFGSDDDKGKLAVDNEPGKKNQIKLPFKDSEGRNIYVSTMFFREYPQLISLMTNPTRLINSKLNAAVAAGIDLLRNKDWKGDPIYDFSINGPHSFIDMIKYIGGTPIPDFIKGDNTFRRDSGRVGGALLSGLTTATGFPLSKGRRTGNIVNANTMAKAEKIIAGKRWRDLQVRKKFNMMNEEELAEAFASGKITPAEYKRLIKLRNSVAKLAASKIKQAYKIKTLRGVK